MAARDLSPAALQVVQAVRARLPERGRVVLAVSGGADSLAMAAAVAWEVGSRSRRGLGSSAVRVVVVDHGLQVGSGEVAERAAEQVRGLGLAGEVVSSQVVSGSVASGPADQGHDDHGRAGAGGGPEAAARNLRLRLLAEAADGDPVFTAHTHDDVAEQVLLGLARGSGARSLAGIPPSQTMIISGVELCLVRPLLTVNRSTTAQACRDFGLTPWHDPHNADEAFTRVRVRSTVLPMLERELGPGVGEALVRTAGLLRDDADLLDDLTVGWLAEATTAWGELRAAELAGEAPAKASRVVRAWLAERGVQAMQAHVIAVLGLIERRTLGVGRGQGGVDLPGGRVVRDRDLLRWELGPTCR